jgi:hypothetical protein
LDYLIVGDFIEGSFWLSECSNNSSLDPDHQPHEGRHDSESVRVYPLLYSMLMAITSSLALTDMIEMWLISKQKASRVLESEMDPTSEYMSREEEEVNAIMLVAASNE